MTPCRRCADDHRERLRFGCLTEASISSIWNGPGFETFRTGLQGGAVLPSICEECPDLDNGKGALPVCENTAVRMDVDAQFSENKALLREDIRNGAVTLRASPTSLEIGGDEVGTGAKSNWQFPDTAEQIFDLTRRLLTIRVIDPGSLGYTVFKEFLVRIGEADRDRLNFTVELQDKNICDDILATLTLCKNLDLVVKPSGPGRVFDESDPESGQTDFVDAVQRLKQVAATMPGVRIMLKMVVSKSNFHELPEFIRFAARQGLSFDLEPIRHSIKESLYTYNNCAHLFPLWQEHLNRARHYLQMEWLPGYFGTDNFEPDDIAPWREKVNQLQSSLEWWRLEDLAVNLEIELPNRIIRLLPKDIVRSYEQDPKATMGIVHIFPSKQLHERAPFYAPIIKDVNGKFHFSVSLPPGRYNAFLGDAVGHRHADWMMLVVPSDYFGGMSLKGYWRPNVWTAFWWVARVFRRLRNPIRAGRI